MKSEYLRVLITGAAGRIAYSLIPLIGRGDAFGPNQVVDLILLDMPNRVSVLRGIMMEIQDSNMKMIRDVYITTNDEEAFMDIDVAILIGSFPRREGMERVELLEENKKIFIRQGQLLDKYSRKDVKVLVVGNPCNTNAYILAKYAKSIKPTNITCLMQLDHNRAVSLLSNKLNISPEIIHNLVVWGNHSNTQVPSFEHVKIEGCDCGDVSGELLKKCNALEMIENIRNRGGDVIKYLGGSSAFSAAIAICDHFSNWYLGLESQDFASMGVRSDGSYDVPEGLYFGLPVKCTGKFQYEIVNTLTLSPQLKKQISDSSSQLLEELKIASIGI